MYTYSGFATNGDYIWYVGERNQIIQVDIQKGIMSYLGMVPGMFNRVYAYRTLVYLDDVIYLIPYYASQLCAYHLTTHKFEFIEFPADLFLDSEINRSFIGAKIVENDLVLYGLLPIVVIFNVRNRNFKSYRIDMEEAKNYGIDSVNFWRDGLEINGTLLIPLDYSNCAYKIDLLHNTANLIQMGEYYIRMPFQMMKRTGRFIYRITSNEDWKIQIFVIDEKFPEKQIELCNFQVEHDWIPENGQVPFLYGEIMDERLFLIPAYQDKTYIVDLKNGKVDSFIGETVKNKQITLKSNSIIRNYFSGICVNQSTFATIHSACKKLVLIHGNQPYENSINLTMEDGFYLKYNKDIFDFIINTNVSMDEQDGYSLVDYLQCVKDKKVDEDK